MYPIAATVAGITRSAVGVLTWVGACKPVVWGPLPRTVALARHLTGIIPELPLSIADTIVLLRTIGILAGVRA